MTLPWVDELRTALDAEFGAGPRVGSFATVDPEGRPRVRSVVCRRIDDSGSLWIASDARSAKNRDVAGSPFAEMVFWLAGAREQFRVAGRVERLDPDDPRREPFWREMSDAARSLFFSPPPGSPVDGVSDVTSPSDNALPASFQPLILHPDRAEHLDLKPHPHRRREWVAAQGWAERAIHP